MANIDITEDLIPDDDKLSSINQLAEMQLELEAEVAAITLQLGERQKDLRRIQEMELPNAMKDAGIEEIKLTNGAKLSIKEDISISVPKNNLDKIVEWLNEQGHGDIVKHEVSVTVPKGEDEKHQKLLAGLKKLGLVFEDGATVNSSTLKALLKEQKKKLAESGQLIDLKLFGAYEWKKSIIKL